MNEFEVKILSLNWMPKGDESYDLCAHGEVYVRIGDEVVCDSKSGNWTISATGLYLLRSLSQNYQKGQYCSQLLPCCGFSIFEDEQNPDSVLIAGCQNGIDWTIEHIDTEFIKHTTENAAYCIEDKIVFKEKVSEFVREVEEFYQKSVLKKLPDDSYERRTYIHFWREWNFLKKQNCINTGILISPQ